MDSRTGLPVVGMVGGGQLARMTHQAAIALGQSLRVLALAPDDGAALVAADVQYGDHTDLAALRTFAKGCDVVTFDHEHVPNEHIRALTDEGVKLFPPAEALVHAQDKRVMRERLGELGAPNPAWRPVESPADLVAFGEETGWPVVLKAARGGYDGRGVWMVDDAGAAGELAATLLAGGTPLLVEERVALRRELAVQVARSPFGQVAAYPVVETVQRDGICVEVLAPAPDLPEEQAVAAQQLAIDLATALGVVGLLAVELFDTPSGLVVNELAMRPHNSGHWTIEGARTSQFEQHLRAVLDYPMGDTSLTAPVVVMANVLGGEPGGISIDERLHHLFAAEPGAKVHLYGKQVRPGRKIGHVTVLGNDLEDVRARAARAARWLQEGH
ncbi:MULTISPECIES: 5-(carboxyamino)imidazole ribonucleotide synthase [Micromonospora]|uniref:5-(carboxyamino)imidazole ribonucleotide synthase n=1 Tax=Micromonospora TaxID=1873 RepID=UPI0003EEC548|nr:MULTISPECIES: 5-(carboxyamino)imidazole ribonucleotide synthase [unclassified Micromonospora]EWM65880.1 phosphoribosylaminoimidazole carboxylase, ATPase subunit [Micromonospora sp. M42]MCK1808319.1 5-(carboxyamino)imidazole ribonucleotide synthase [Micromonospora sp. R42106]MCK1834372.1 5-(carboxyamino)imidazole ribonucleotide synthase [Micromonospora sp. R42003]MCK1844222.1 5-(carboxyamino)imidazole ribonucleotide synthase [Micromonospora sp. R42004]MCM1015674.1 5-(carboxyamino)imidazole r